MECRRLPPAEMRFAAPVMFTDRSLSRSRRSVSHSSAFY